MANPPLYLTADEQKLFKKVPAALSKGWEVKDEKLTFVDSSEQYAIRMRNLHISYKPLADAMKKAKSIKNTADLFALSSSIDFSNVPEKEILEVYYLMGPQVFTDTLNVMLLKGLKTPADIQVFVSNAIIRHELLVSLNLPPKY